MNIKKSCQCDQEFIKAIGSCGSYLDGGANVPFQEAAISMLEPNKVRTEMKALQTHFKMKRDYVVSRLREMGFIIKAVPDSTFYLWLDLEGLPHASKSLFRIQPHLFLRRIQIMNSQPARLNQFPF